MKTHQRHAHHWGSLTPLQEGVYLPFSCERQHTAGALLWHNCSLNLTNLTGFIPGILVGTYPLAFIYN